MRQTHVLTLKTSDHPSSRLLQSPPTPGMAAIALQASSCFIHACRRRSISVICLSRSSKPRHCSHSVSIRTAGKRSDNRCTTPRTACSNAILLRAITSPYSVGKPRRMLVAWYETSRAVDACDAVPRRLVVPRSLRQSPCYSSAWPSRSHVHRLHHDPFRSVAEPSVDRRCPLPFPLGMKNDLQSARG